MKEIELSAAALKLDDDVLFEDEQQIVVVVRLDGRAAIPHQAIGCARQVLDNPVLEVCRTRCLGHGHCAMARKQNAFE